MALSARVPRAALTVLSLTVTGLVACGGSTPGAASGTPMPTSASSVSPTTVDPGPGLHFTVSPIDVSSLIYITSLGAMAPWGHTLPTDHVYFFHHSGNQPYVPVPVYAPAAGRIEGIYNGRIDVRVDSIFIYWIGPLALADGIAVGARVEAGALLGHHSTFPAFDFSVLRSTLRLNFVNPARYGRDTLTADGPVQYFDEPLRSALAAKVLRTGGEIDGRIDYDVDGTLAGNWFAEDLPVAESGRGDAMYYGVRKLAFARDVFSPQQQRVSIGGLGLTGLYGVPADAPDFAAVTPASGRLTYRLMAVGAPQSPPSNTQSGWLQVQLLDASHLRIEATAVPYSVAVTGTPVAPTGFSAKAEMYLR
jgi:hypothetical protein